MNPRIRPVLIIIGLITLVVVSIIVIPRGLSLYYQTRGGQHVEYVLRSTEGIQELVCEQLPVNNEDGRNEVEQAVVDLNRAIRFNKNNAQAYYYLGKANCLLGKPSESKEDYLRYTELRPDNPLGYIGLGFAYEELGDTSAAGNAWRSADLTASDFNQAGDEVFKEEQYEDAILWYERAILVEHKSAESWLNIGKAYDGLQDYESALKASMKAYEINPELSTTALIDSYKRNGDLNSVIDILQQMLEKSPNSSDRLLWFQELGSSYLSQGDYDQAVELYSLAIKEFAEQPDLHISLGWALYERGDGVEVAQSEFEKAIDLDRNNGVGYYAIGSLMNREENFFESQKWLSQASELEPDNRWYLLVYGNAVRSSGNLEKAIEVYEQIINKHPNYDRAYLELAQVYYLLDHTDEAKWAIEKAIESASSPTEWYYIRAGRIYKQAGEGEKALQYYYQALGIDPTNSTALQAVELLEE